MPALLSEILSQVRGIWARLDLGQRLTIGAVMAATLAGLGAIVWFAQLPDWQVVRSSADTRELMQTTRALDQGGVAYKIEGSSVLVDGADVADARRVLASAGIGGAPTLDLGELGGMTTDRATRMHALARFVERDTEQKLAEIDGVLHAQVSHSKPKRSPYRMLDEETQPRANVGLRIERGASFRALAAAARLEAAAALGIPPEHVTVTNLLTGQTDAGDDPERAPTLDTADFVEQQRRRSEELTERAQSLLDLVYPGKAFVRVTVTLDPEWTVTKERGAPDKPAVLHSKTTREDTREPPPLAGGDPSAASSPVGVVGTAVGASAQPSYKKETKEIDYASDAFKETTTGKLAPDVRNMTVVVVADREIVPDAEASTALEQMIKNAIGWAQQFSDDNFTVHVDEIPEMAEPSASVLTGVVPLIERHAPAAAQLLAVVLVLAFLARLLKKGALPRPLAAPVAGAAPTAAETTASPDDERRRMRREIERAIAEDPAAMSRLLETWLMEHKV